MTAGGTGNRGMVPMILGILSETCLAVDRLAEAAGASDTGLALAAQTGQHFWSAELLRLKGESHLRLPDHPNGEAEGLFQQAIVERDPRLPDFAQELHHIRGEADVPV